MANIGATTAFYKVETSLTRANSEVSKSMERLATGKQNANAGDRSSYVAMADTFRLDYVGTKAGIKGASVVMGYLETGMRTLDAASALLARIQELAVLGANETNSSDDHAAIDAEAEALADDRTCRHLSLGDAGKVDLAAQRHFFGVCHSARAGLRVVERRDVRQILIRHVVDLSRHQRDRTTTIANILHLFQQILVAEPRQLGKCRHDTVAIHTVASHTSRCLGLPCFGVTGGIGAGSRGHRYGQKRHF